jgi:CheY-like chemotaxis protein
MGAVETLASQPNQEDQEHPTLLLVDDHPVTLEIERNYFGGVGFHVFAATTPQEVNNIVQNEHIDLIMIDVSFAKNQGLKIVQAVKRASKNSQIKALVTSIMSPPQLRKTAEEAGADDVLIKPAPRPKILREIKRLTAIANRGSERIKQTIVCRMTIGDVTHQAHSLDLSAEGMHLSLDESTGGKPSVDTPVTLELALAEKEKPIKLTGVVVRHTQLGFGVKFDDLNKNTKRSLDKFLLRYSMEHKASQYYL